MPRRAIPVRLVLALPAATLIVTPAAILIATPAGSLASGGPGSHPVAAVSTSNTTAAPVRCGTGKLDYPRAARCVEITAAGFLSGELVLVREFRRPGWQLTVRADTLGRVGYRLPPSATHLAQADVLTFVGLGAASPAGTSGTVSVSVPRTAIYRFGPAAGS